MNDKQWYDKVSAGDDEGWKLVWERVVEPESKSARSKSMMDRYSLSAGDLMGMLYNDMIGRGKIKLFRFEGSFQGWLRRYVRGYVLNADPNPHGEISIEGAYDGDDDRRGSDMDIAYNDREKLRKEAWGFTHWLFRRLWNEDPLRCYIHVLKTRFFLSSDEIKDFLDISSASNVDQIFSRSVKFMRENWVKYDKVKK